MLNVQVTDLSDKPVTGLKPEDFTLLDNHKPQKIAAFREVDGQAFSSDVHVVLVLDAINDGGSAIGHLKKDFGRFLSLGHEPLAYPLSLIFVSDAGAVESQPSTDRAVIAAQLAQFAHRPHSSDCEPIESIEGSRMQGQPTPTQGSRTQEQADCMTAHFTQSVAALRNLLAEQQNLPGRAILVWAGAGWPMVADYGAGPGAGEHPGNYRDVLVELTMDLREAQVTLDAISWGDFKRPKHVRKPIVSVNASVPYTPDQIAEEEMALSVLARLSGGQAVAKVKNFSDIFATFLAGADHFYGLSFDSVPAAAPDEFHTIEVKVDRPGVTVRTSTAYYAQP